MKKMMALTILAGLTMVYGCTTTEGGALVGGGLGAGTGAIIGHQTGHTTEGALIGAAVGGLAGALVGNKMDTMYCPVCGRKYTSGTAYCPVDGAALKPVGGGSTQPQQQTQQVPAQQQQQQAPLTMYCPTCGARYTSDYGYCTKDGTKLNPIQ